MQFINMSGANAFETGKPLQNTVSYFRGSQDSYAVLSGAGAVTDLTSSDPGFVNLDMVLTILLLSQQLSHQERANVELPAGTTTNLL